MTQVEAHRELMAAAIAREEVAHRASLAGDLEASRAAFRAAAASYRASWEEASPTSFGRLVGMLKAAILAGDAAGEAAYVEQTLADAEATSPTAAYAQAIAALVLGEDRRAGKWAGLMHGPSPAFDRTATAIAALADSDAPGYRAALEEIVGDFAVREAHLTGVPIADTALMLEALATPRGLRVGLEGPLMPRLDPSDPAPAPDGPPPPPPADRPTSGGPPPIPAADRPASGGPPPTPAANRPTSVGPAPTPAADLPTPGRTA